MKPPALIAGIILALIYLGACGLYWHESSKPNLNLCPLCGKETEGNTEPNAQKK
jgi:hypothetical protein